MTTLREAAQQALEAWDGGDTEWFKRAYTVMDALRAALVEDVMQKFTDVNQELEAALAEPCPCGDKPADQCPGEWEPGCDLGNNPKYAKRVEMTPKELAASIKRGEKWKVAEPVQEPPCATRECMPSECPNCASLEDQNTELDRKLAEMEEKLNNPSVDDAFRILAEANRRAIDYINELERQINELKRADPTHRKPLTEEEIDGLMQSIGLRCADDGNERMANHAEWERRQRRRIARAIERAHGIVCPRTSSCGAASIATATSEITKAVATNVGCGAAQPAH